MRVAARLCQYRRVPKTPFLDRQSVQIGYVVLAGVLAIVGWLLSTLGSFPVLVSIVVIALYLGPIGIASLVVFGFAVLLFAGSVDGAIILPAIIVVLSVGIAIANVFIVRRWRARTANPTTPSAGLERPRSPHGAWSAILFSLAGCTFIFLCIVAGFEGLTAHGIDEPVPDSIADPIVAVAAITWWIGLAVAVGGLVIWIVRARRHLSLLPWAFADLLIQAAIFTTLIVITTNLPS